MRLPYRNDLTAEDLRSQLAYDEETGFLRWKKSKSTRIKPGDIAGCKLSNGYITIRLNGGLYLAHRLVWLYVHGEWPEAVIDHIDGDRTNNRLANLRAASLSQNRRNIPHKGYYFVEREGLFKARISIAGKSIHLGSFRTADEARAAYVAAVLKNFGDSNCRSVSCPSAGGLS